MHRPVCDLAVMNRNCRREAPALIAVAGERETRRPYGQRSDGTNVGGVEIIEIEGPVLC